MDFKHRVKKRIFDRTQKKYRDIIINAKFRLGSGIFDKNGVEIFEGDTVKIESIMLNVTDKVIYVDGEFILCGMTFRQLIDEGVELEIVGHTED